MRWLMVLLMLMHFTVEAKPKRVPQPQPDVAYALWNVDTESLITDYHAEEVRSMASITKLMNALVILQSGLDLDEVLTVTGKEGSRRIRQGMQLTRGRLLELSLISSDNLAARTLAETYPGGYDRFIEEMNHTARSLGMESTNYADSTGLLAANRSSAVDISKLVMAVSPFSIITNAANTTKTVLDAVVAGKRKSQSVQVHANNTNFFAGKLNLVAAKTGFTSSAGMCLTMLFNQNGSRYLLVVMGAQSLDHRKKLVMNLLDRIKY